MISLNIGEKIKDLRLERGYTLEELGNKIGVGKSTVRKWEQGTIANMGQDKIAKLSQIFGVSADYFVNDSLSDIIPPEDDPEVLQLFADSVDYLQNKKIRTIILLVRNASDEELDQYIRIIAALQGIEPPAFKQQADKIRAKLANETE